MMWNSTARWGRFVVLTGLFGAISVGCGTQANRLPESVSVELPDGTSVNVTLGAGVASLANSSWRFFVTGDASQSNPFVEISFGPNGELERFDNNTIADEIFGATILFDGDRHSTEQQGLSYAAATYGAETSDATGFAFEGRMTLFAAGITAATATAQASGSFDPDDPDTMYGAFAFTSEVTIASIPEGNVDLAFGYVAHRIVEE